MEIGENRLGVVCQKQFCVQLRISIQFLMSSLTFVQLFNSHRSQAIPEFSQIVCYCHRAIISNSSSMIKTGSLDFSSRLDQRNSNNHFPDFVNLCNGKVLNTTP